MIQGRPALKNFSFVPKNSLKMPFFSAKDSVVLGSDGQLKAPHRTWQVLDPKEHVLQGYG